MFLTDYKKLIIALLLLAFTSQTMATAAMTCKSLKAIQALAATPTMSPDHHKNLDHANHLKMDHIHSDPMPAHHDKSLMSDTNSKSNSQHHPENIDCCQTIGHCLLGRCVLATASNTASFSFARVHSAAEDFYSGVTPKPLSSSLYRPPIFC